MLYGMGKNKRDEKSLSDCIIIIEDQIYRLYFIVSAQTKKLEYTKNIHPATRLIQGF